MVRVAGYMHREDCWQEMDYLALGLKFPGFSFYRALNLIGVSALSSLYKHTNPLQGYCLL